MNARIIAIADYKGGVGKTTTAMSIAGLLARRGEHVTLLDADNTGGAILWERYVSEADPDADLGFAIDPATAAALDPARLRQRYDGWVVIDTPPSDSDTIDAAIAAADLTIIPCQPSTSDMTHAGKTFQECMRRMSRPDALFLLTRVKTNTRLAQESIAALDGQNLPRFENVIRERESIKQGYGTPRFDSEYIGVVSELLEYLAAADRRNGGE